MPFAVDQNVIQAVQADQPPKNVRLVEIRSFSLFTRLEADELGVPREEYVVKGVLKLLSYPG
jgi:hypothetical protein